MNRLLALGLFLTLTLSLVAAASAELPPGSYDKLRKEAQEALIIEVTDVTTTLVAGGTNQVIVKAKVLAVERSTAGLKKGDSIRIQYETHPPMPGPKPIPLLKAEEILPAFLNAKGRAYEPAAHGWSFVMTPEG